MARNSPNFGELGRTQSVVRPCNRRFAAHRENDVAADALGEAQREGGAANSSKPPFSLVSRRARWPRRHAGRGRGPVPFVTRGLEAVSDAWFGGAARQPKERVLAPIRRQKRLHGFVARSEDGVSEERTRGGYGTSANRRLSLPGSWPGWGWPGHHPCVNLFSFHRNIRPSACCG